MTICPLYVQWLYVQQQKDPVSPFLHLFRPCFCPPLNMRRAEQSFSFSGKFKLRTLTAGRTQRGKTWCFLEIHRVWKHKNCHNLPYSLQAGPLEPVMTYKNPLLNKACNENTHNWEVMLSHAGHTMHINTAGDLRETLRCLMNFWWTQLTDHTSTRTKTHSDAQAPPPRAGGINCEQLPQWSMLSRESVCGRKLRV